MTSELEPCVSSFKTVSCASSRQGKLRQERRQAGNVLRVQEAASCAPWLSCRDKSLSQRIRNWRTTWMSWGKLLLTKPCRTTPPIAPRTVTASCWTSSSWPMRSWRSAKRRCWSSGPRSWTLTSVDWLARTWWGGGDGSRGWASWGNTEPVGLWVYVSLLLGLLNLKSKMSVFGVSESSSGVWYHFFMIFMIKRWD